MNKSTHLIQITDKARQLMNERNIDALILSTPENFYHLTGHQSFFLYTFKYTGAAVAILFRDEKIPSLVLMNEFEAQGVSLEMPNYILKTFPIWVDIDTPFMPQNTNKRRPILPPTEQVLAVIKEYLIAHDKLNKNIAIEFPQISLQTKVLLDKIFGNVNWHDSNQLIDELRTIKTDYEIEHLRKSAFITERGIEAAINSIEAGCSAYELTHAYQKEIANYKETSHSRFHLISIGELFSPQKIPSKQTIKEGDLIKLDCGVDVEGYGADIARTVSFKKPTKKAEEIFDIILAGHEHMLSLVKPFESMEYVFNSTIKKIQQMGLPNYQRGHLGHSNGLSLGLEEPPFVKNHTNSIFLPGMVLSLETPYYGIGVGSIMIEDMLLITKTGYELFSQLPRSLINK
ncbi:M24 family metallopeptidase [Thorsellia kenyensis]|uniref:M24 family metallopeptidase n=1 Tax=Thorsellia kenyensis TaxID=1549888 RepID=A0ABV6CCH9_9GAMM